MFIDILKTIFYNHKILLCIVVTGSSRGIGKAYARELARRGINVVLLSNEKEELEQVSKELGKSILLIIETQS